MRLILPVQARERNGQKSRSLLRRASARLSHRRGRFPLDDGIEETDCRTYCAAGPGWPEVLDCRARMGHDCGLSWSWELVLDFFDRHSG